MRRADAAVVFACCSVLLSYPEASFTDDLDAVAEAVHGLPRGQARRLLGQAREQLYTVSEVEAASRYVETFDMTRRRCLYLTYYRHGDTRERGMALTAMLDAYRKAGLALSAGELPDFLPALLELAAVSTSGATLLAEHRPALEALAVELERAGSAYGDVVRAVTTVLGPVSRADRAAAHSYRSQGPPSEQVGLEPFAPPEFLGQGVTGP